MSSSVPIPIGQPLPGASLGQATGRFFRGYFHFSGRASRSEFWWAMLAVWLLSLVPLVPAMLLAARLESWRQPGSAVITQVEAQQTVTTFFVLLGASVLLSLITTIPTYAVMWRRLQDANVHGAWILLTLVGLSIIPLVICFFGSNPAGARFGPPPPPSPPAFGFPSDYGYASPAMVRQQRFGTSPQPLPQAPAPATAYGSYNGASYGGTPYGQPPSGPAS